MFLAVREAALKTIPACVYHVSLTGSLVGSSSQKTAVKDETGVSYKTGVIIYSLPHPKMQAF